MVSLHRNKGRREHKEYLIEGKRFVREAFLRKAEVTRVFYCRKSKELSRPASQSEGESTISDLIGLAEKFSVPVTEVNEAVMQKISSTEQPQGVLATAKISSADWEDVVIQKDSIVLIIDNIKDPGNLGTILRTALAADVDQVILTRETVDMYNPKVLRSSMGAIFSQKILTDRTPEEIVNFCRKANCTLAVSTMGGDSIFSPGESIAYPLALVIGNEAFGPSLYFLERAEKKYSIPMFNNVESLNAAMAAGIFLYELRRKEGFL